MVPDPFGANSKSTWATPAGLARARNLSRSGRSRSRIEVLSATVIGPMPTLWWNAAPTRGHSGSTARISLQPTTQNS